MALMCSTLTSYLIHTNSLPQTLVGRGLHRVAVGIPGVDETGDDDPDSSAVVAQNVDDADDVDDDDYDYPTGYLDRSDC